MPHFTVVDSIDKIQIHPGWIPSAKFDSKDRVVTRNGKVAASDEFENRYRIIQKWEHTFSTCERIQRGFLATTAVVCSIGLAFLLFPQWVKNLFTQAKEKIRFAIPDNSTRFRVENGSIVYIAPKCLDLFGTEIGNRQELNFALIQDHEQQTLKSVVSEGIGYKIYEGSALDVLLRIAQDPRADRNLDFYSLSFLATHEALIVRVLNHPNNKLFTKAGFCDFILQNEVGKPRLCTLNAVNTLAALCILQEENREIDCLDQLLAKWAGKGRGEIVQLILDLKPSAIQAVKPIHLVASVMRGDTQEAKTLFAAVDKAGKALNGEALWMKRALNNESFSNEEFASLDLDLQCQIFFAANIHGHESLVQRLKQLGMDQEPIHHARERSIFTANMDILTTKEVLEGFLKDLRKDRRLLTADEFAPLAKESEYHVKSDQIGRIQGKFFIEKVIRENGLKHIKVPNKIAVIQGNVESVAFRVMPSGHIIPQEESKLMICAEHVEAVDRKLSLEEALEFMTVLVKTGFNDFWHNILSAQDGLYFIDTEYGNFNPEKPHWGAIESIQKNLNPQDVELFLKAYNACKAEWEQEAPLREAQYKEYNSAMGARPFARLVQGYGEKHEFVFPVASLLAE